MHYSSTLGILQMRKEKGVCLIFRLHHFSNFPSGVILTNVWSAKLNQNTHSWDGELCLLQVGSPELCECAGVKKHLAHITSMKSHQKSSSETEWDLNDHWAKLWMETLSQESSYRAVMCFTAALLQSLCGKVDLFNGGDKHAINPRIKLLFTSRHVKTNIVAC